MPPGGPFIPLPSLHFETQCVFKDKQQYSKKKKTPAHVNHVKAYKKLY